MGHMSTEDDEPRITVAKLRNATFTINVSDLVKRVEDCIGKILASYSK